MPLLKYISRLSVKVVLLLALLGGSIFAFGFIIHEVLLEKEEQFDYAVANTINSWVHSEVLISVMEGLSFLASSDFLIVAYAFIVIWLWLKRKRTRAFEIGLIGLIGHVLTHSLKIFFQRGRPSQAEIYKISTYSFPSGHATSAFILYGLLIWLATTSKISRSLKFLITISLLILTLLIGFSRIYLGVHYASDVLAGFCVGATWLVFTIWVLTKIERPKVENQKS